MATLTLQPDASAGIDCGVRESAADTNYATAANFDILGFSGSRGFALIKFDLSSLSGATINSATLYLYIR